MKIIRFICLVFGRGLKMLYVHFMLKAYLRNTVSLNDTSRLGLELDDSQLVEISFDKSRYIRMNIVQ